MAARRKRAPARAAADDGRDGDDDGEGSADSMTDAVLAEQSERVKEREPMASIRRADASGRSQFLDTVPLGQVTEDWLADTYGGGKYQVMQRGLKADGSWGYVGHDTYEIDVSLPFKGSLRKQKAEQDERGRFADAEMSLHAADGRMIGGASRMDSIIEGGIIGLMRKSEETSANAMTMQLQLMQESRAQSQATLTMMMKMMETAGGARANPLLETMLTALAPSLPDLIKMVAGRKENSMMEMLAVVEKLQPKGEGAKLNDALDMVRKLREAAQDVTGDAEPASPAFRIMEKLAEFLPVLVARQQGAPAPTPTATASVPTPAGADVPSSSLSGGEVPMIEGPEDVWRLIEGQIATVRAFAAMGRDPRRVAAMAVEFASSPQRALMTEVLADENFDKLFFERFPQMETYRRWTESFIEELRTELFGEDDGGSDDDESEPPTAGAGDGTEDRKHQE